MKKIAAFIVSKRFLLAGAVLIAAVVGAVLFSFVKVNTDLTKYLPDSSSMKQGMDIMEEEFPNAEETYTIRVMSEGLSEAEQKSLIEALEKIPDVDSVDHDESEYYNAGDYNLYVLSTSYDYDTPEEAAIEEALKNDFGEYDIVYKNDATKEPDLPLKIVLAAMAIIVLILLLTAQSWFEPVLFLATTGVAVLINSGTNIILGEISSVTSQIAYILQLVLSMDYSIMLLNRYRENRALCSSKNDTMVKALSEAFAPIASSSLTTVVGLLMLCFMEFKIGMDIGIVLAKGVFISMLCVLLLMPCLIILCDKLIMTAAKPHLRIPMGWAATFSFKMRHVLLGAFLVLFAGFFILQQRTEIVYTLAEDDPIADVFTPDNTTVLIYNNADEKKVSGLIDLLEEDENVRTVQGYANTLGLAYSAADMTDTLSELSSDLKLDPVLIKLVYYMYFDGSSEFMQMEDFLNFLSENVIDNESFAEYLDEEIKDQADELKKFADVASLTETKSAADLSEVLGIDEATIRDLLLYYYTKYGGVSAGTMKISTFVSFLLNEVAADDTYGSMIDTASLSSLKELRTYTDYAYITQKRSYTSMADILAMDSSSAKLLYVYYYYMSGTYSPQKMTLPQFVSVITSSGLASYIDADMLAQINQLAPFTDTSAIQQQMSASAISSYLGIDESTLSIIFTLSAAPDVNESTMTLPDFLTFLKAIISGDVPGGDLLSGNIDSETISQVDTLSAIVNMAVSGEMYGAADLSAVTGIDESLISQMFMYQSMTSGQSVSAMTLPDFLTLASNMFSTLGVTDEATIAQLNQLQQIVSLATSGAALDGQTMASLFGLDEAAMTLLYRLYFGYQSGIDSMSLYELVAFILSDEAVSSMLDQGSLTQLTTLKNIMDVSLSQTAFSYSEMAGFLGTEAESLRFLFVYNDSATSAANSWALSVYETVTFILNNQSMFSSMMSSADLSNLSLLQKIMTGVINGTYYSPAGLADLFGMNSSDLESLFLLYISRHGNISGWGMSVKNLVDFLVSDVLTDANYSGMIDVAYRSELRGLKKLVDAVISEKKYSPEECYEILSALSDALDENMLELLYLYKSSLARADSGWLMSIDSLFYYLHDDVINDARFKDLIDDKTRDLVKDYKATLDDALTQLVGPDYSRLVIITKYPAESAETTGFFDRLNGEMNNFDADSYLIGESAMSWEMAQTFNQQMWLITILAAAAIFIIVLLTFRNFIIPFMLVFLVQCGVYITIAVTGLLGYTEYYLAYVIVECILMGATVDYAILFTNFYLTGRKTMPVRDAINFAYGGSMHTITTSGLVITTVTGILGFFAEDPTTAEVCRTVAIGALSVILLIIFILPGVLAAADRLITKKKELSRS